MAESGCTAGVARQYIKRSHEPVSRREPDSPVRFLPGGDVCPRSGATLRGMAVALTAPGPRALRQPDSRPARSSTRRLWNCGATPSTVDSAGRATRRRIGPRIWPTSSGHVPPRPVRRRRRPDLRGARSLVPGVLGRWRSRDLSRLDGAGPARPGGLTRASRGRRSARRTGVGRGSPSCTPRTWDSRSTEGSASRR